ncbi:MAG: M23 family metallopeptidase, partial [Flammeovirgaceae bacterium]|nr:M23 family metallopeptidase [Flammeovirgaceae bacterium]
MRSYWNSRLSRVFPAVFLLPTFVAFSQLSRPELPAFKKEDEKYLYPVNPGMPGSLAGNMGELRSNHFHSGIDIRTNNTIGLPVLASKSGYVSRATMSSTGYGNVLYIKHPDGNTTLYAHLDKFNGDVADYILKEQYRRKTGEIDLYFRENQFLIKRGDTVALSGNTGSSSGPHLHFDIRDDKGNALDPLSFGFDEITDTFSPKAEKVALVTLDANSRINDKFGRFEFYVLKVGENYQLPQPILASGNIGIELIAKDRFAYKGHFFGGVKFIEVFANGKKIFSQQIENINLAETRKINTALNFKAMRTNGSKFYKLYLDDGNDLQIYDKRLSGKFSVAETGVTKIEIKLKDVANNSSTFLFSLKYSPPSAETTLLEPMRNELAVDVHENILSLTSKMCHDAPAKVYVKGSSVDVSPSYYNQNQSNYLIDLRRLLPDSITTCKSTYATNLKSIIPYGIDYTYYSDWLEVDFEKDCLYDTLYFINYKRYANDSSVVYGIGDKNVPLHKSLLISIRKDTETDWNQKTAVYRIVGKGFAFNGGALNNGRISFSTREFGEFTILEDSIAPTIRPIYITNQNVRFKIKDNLAGINRFEATLNGRWLLLHYDAKTGIL